MELSFAGEEGGGEEELAEDAAGGPEVDGGSVAGGGEEELGRAVPDGYDAGREGAGGVVARETKVGCGGISVRGGEGMDGEADRV